MRLSPEDVFRKQLATGPDCLSEALESIVPREPTDDPATELARRLCFDTARLRPGEEKPPFCEVHPAMLAHGLRQVALARTVLNNEIVRPHVPSWLDHKLFGLGLLVTDVGVIFVPDDEVDIVNKYGPKYMDKYDRHPKFGHDMSLNVEGAKDLTDARSQFLRIFIARHHATQVKYPYGLPWHEVDYSLLADPMQVDLAILIGKPFDFFDDTFGRVGKTAETYDSQAHRPHQKFTDHYYKTFALHLDVVNAMRRTGVESTLPNLISEAIQVEVQTGEPEGIGAVYRHHRPDLSLPRLSETA